MHPSYLLPRPGFAHDDVFSVSSKDGLSLYSRLAGVIKEIWAEATGLLSGLDTPLVT